MSDWYHAKNGKSIGPFSLEDIKSLVEKEEIGAMDLVFKRGEEVWKPLSEWSEFSSFIQAQNSEYKMSQWILYTRQSGEDKKTGPYSTEIIQKKLATGEVSYDDFLWREGMSDWCQIRSLKDFQSKSDSPTGSISEENLDVEIVNEKEIYSQSAETLLKNVKIRDAKQAYELTKTLTQSVTGTLPGKENKIVKSEVESPIESEDLKPGSEGDGLTDLALSRAELIEKRRELDLLMKKVFGESGSGDGSTKIEKSKYLSQTVEQLANQLPVKQALKEKGYFKEKKIISEDSGSETGGGNHDDPTEKDKIHQLTNYIENFSPEKKYNQNGFFQKIGQELNALFPRGSLLRLFALFFTIFAFAIIIILSSYRDQSKVEVVRAGDQAFDVQQGGVSEEKILAQINNKENKVAGAKMKLQPTSPPKPPSRLDIFLDTEKGKLDLIFKTDASSHYTVEVTVWADVKEVLGKGGYYYKSFLKGKPPYKLDLLGINVPIGFLSVEARVGDISKTLKLNNFKDKKVFERDLGLNKKQVAIWHQKEKRSLYATINQLNDYGLQLQSLIPLATQGQSRWSKAYKNLKTRVSQSRSSYLRQVGNSIGSELVYPLLWQKILELENEIMGLDSDPSSFDYLSFKKRMSAAESEVARLSLW